MGHRRFRARICGPPNVSAPTTPTATLMAGSLVIPIGWHHHSITPCMPVSLPVAIGEWFRCNTCGKGGHQVTAQIKMMTPVITQSPTHSTTLAIPTSSRRNLTTRRTSVPEYGEEESNGGEGGLERMGLLFSFVFFLALQYV